LAETRSELRVVADQFGSPTYAPDIANAVIAIARNLLANPADQRLRGLFHLSGSGETNWAEFASTLFAYAGLSGLKVPTVVPITTAEYPTPAKRPTNSRLDCTRLREIHDVQLPHWKESLHQCIDRIVRRRC
jgi:dTDP-4-dehydrorhamnose reductase